MNRELSSKAKRLDNGEWIEGYLFCQWDRVWILWGTTNGVPNMQEVDPSTVCQCTGLMDKYGKRIFEGDVFVAGYYKWKCKVMWDEKCARFIGLTNDKDVKIVYIDMVDKDNTSAVEVIGNIFDNPELLEVQQS